MKNNNVDPDPTGTLVKMFEEICTNTGVNLEDVLPQFPGFVRDPVCERLGICEFYVNYYDPYTMTKFVLLSDVNTSVLTEDGRTLNLNDFAGLSIEQSNLMVVLNPTLPALPETNKRIISSYTNSVDASKAFMSLWDTILRDERLWDVNVFNKNIPYKENYQ